MHINLQLIISISQFRWLVVRRGEGIVTLSHIAGEIYMRSRRARPAVCLYAAVRHIAGLLTPWNDNNFKVSRQWVTYKFLREIMKKYVANTQSQYMRWRLNLLDIYWFSVYLFYSTIWLVYLLTASKLYTLKAFLLMYLVTMLFLITCWS